MLKSRQTTLISPQDISRSAQPKVLLRYLKTIPVFRQKLEPILGGKPSRPLDQDTFAALSAPPNSPAQLMQLRESQTVGMINHHPVRLRHVHPHLHHSRRHQNRNLSRPE